MTHYDIMELVRSELETALITNIDGSDPARAGVVKLGPLQGDPEPDEARIAVTIHENDPDEFSSVGYDGAWQDVIEEVEIGNGSGLVTWRRRFTVKARCLLENTQEELAAARQIASTLRQRIEIALLGISFASISVSGETVSRGVTALSLHGKTKQLGGPPDAYDFHIKVRFDVLTTGG